MKKIAVVTFSADVGRFYSEQLQKLFVNLPITRYAFEEGIIDKPFTEDLIVIATHSIYATVSWLIPKTSDVVITKITLSKEGLEQIQGIEPGTKVMLVNLSVEMCMETISLIYQLGINHIELIPVYPEMKKVPRMDIAITPSEKRYVPSKVKKIIDIGHRRLDISTIVEIAFKLKAEALLQEDAFQNYFNSIVDNHYSFDALTGKNRCLETQFDILLKVLEEGIIGVNGQGIIFAYNDSAEKIMGLKRGDVLGKNSMELFSDIPFEKAFLEDRSVKSKLIQWNNVYLSAEVFLVIDAKRVIGAFALIKKFNDMEQQQHDLRMQLVKKGYRAKYIFEDIIGQSAVMVEAKKLAYKMAQTDLAVLILGESGTGKELFAQAIHNESNRKELPFVAVNCAAIPENLLESELFGYEEGAFTGAKKGGKRGLFEFAHQGTLFLDEIGETSLGLQAKLLRVLQEKEVVRVSGDQVIKVDVRIIAATNENLRKLVDQGRFRRDLYYRISVLPLKIPPLRKRGMDILLLAEQFQDEIGKKAELPKALRTAFLEHGWEGNVRELRNYVECISHIGFHDSLFSELPLARGNIALSSSKMTLEEFPSLAGKKQEAVLFILEQLTVSRQRQEKMGRRRLVQLAQEKGVFITEQEVRMILLKLAKLDLVIITIGRSGSQITDKGVTYLQKQKG